MDLKEEEPRGMQKVMIRNSSIKQHPHDFRTGFDNDWLEPEARREFNERTKCVAENLAEYKAEVPTTIYCSIFTFEILHSFTAVGL